MSKTIRTALDLVSNVDFQRLIHRISDSDYRPMRPELRHRWVEALRSGTYGQVKDFLAVDGSEGHELDCCCLGVLCTIDPALTEIDDRDTGIREFGFVAPEAEHLKPSSRTMPSDAIYASWKLDSRIGSCLAGLNDEDYGFDVLAEIIEELI